MNDNLYDMNLADMRTFLMVELHKPYITFTREERTWHPFYISSGTGSGAARKGRPQPFLELFLLICKCMNIQVREHRLNIIIMIFWKIFIIIILHAK